MKIEEWNGVEYEVRESGTSEQRDIYKWYKRIVPKGYPDSSWRYAGIYQGSLDTQAWVFRQGSWWKWRVKKFSWYDEGMEKTLGLAMRAVEKQFLARTRKDG